jgi:hypothetical protein
LVLIDARSRQRPRIVRVTCSIGVPRWRSQREAAELAMSKWTRVKANISLGAYEMSTAEGVMAEPVWPDATFQELLKIAFRDRMITSLDHLVIKRLRGLS